MKWLKENCLLCNLLRMFGKCKLDEPKVEISNEPEPTETEVK